MKHSKLINELTQIFGDQTKTLLKNFYGLGKGFDLENIDKELKDKRSLSNLVRFFIKEKENYLNNNKMINCHVKVLKIDGVKKELFVGNDKPFCMNDWEGVSRIN